MFFLSSYCGHREGEWRCISYCDSVAIAPTRQRKIWMLWRMKFFKCTQQRRLISLRCIPTHDNNISSVSRDGIFEWK
jgi:hypothetical protein